MSTNLPSIFAIGTAVPERTFSQKEAESLLPELLNLSPSLTSWYRRISKHSAIESRQTCAPDIAEISHASFSRRNALFKSEAPKLAISAAKEALTMWGGSSEEITHVITVTCTGVTSPGIEVSLIEALKLSPSVERICVNFMGCFGAFKGLGVAAALAKEDPKARILVVCTELCTLHFCPVTKREQLIGHVLFSDGSAAALVGSMPHPHERPLCQMIKRHSYVLPSSEEEMTWDAGDHCFEMRLTTEVPKQIKAKIPSFVEELIGGQPSREDGWALHPGGKAIMDGIEAACSLDRSQTLDSWDVLRNYGNMSSPTFLFVLERALKRKTRRIIGLGFGPGLSLEGMLFEKTL